MSREAPPEDYCSCAKRPGAWGQGRFHHIVITEAIAEKMAGREHVERRQQGGAIPDSESDQMWNEIMKHHQAYIGTKIAFEECPQALDRIRRQCELEANRREMT
jgi:hypothetical protein